MREIKGWAEQMVIFDQMPEVGAAWLSVTMVWYALALLLTTAAAALASIYRSARKNYFIENNFRFILLSLC